MEEWKECKLGDIVEINPTESLKKGTVAKKLGMDVLQPYCRAIPSFSFEPYTGGTKFKNGDTIMARITPCLENGKTAMVNILDDNEIGFGSTEYIVFRAKNNITDPYFIYYLVTSDCIRNPAIKSMVGSSGRQRVQTDVVANLSINLPPLPTQQKIAAILSSLDDKIELNNKINANLEQQAGALFKNWFVDFEPFGGKMPAGWKVGKLSEIADYLNGLAMQKFRPLEDEEGLPVLKIKELRQGCYDESSELCSPSKVKPEYIIHDGDVIFSWSGSLLVDIWCGGTCGLNQHLFKVTSQTYEKWFYYLWTKHHLDKFIFLAADKATTMGHIKREELDKAEVVIPDDKTYQNLTFVIKPFIDEIINNRIENRKLSQIRDGLLPKLMNGEIEV